jgi:hypothetical protein
VSVPTHGEEERDLVPIYGNQKAECLNRGECEWKMQQGMRICGCEHTLSNVSSLPRPVVWLQAYAGNLVKKIHINSVKRKLYGKRDYNQASNIHYQDCVFNFYNSIGTGMAKFVNVS